MLYTYCFPSCYSEFKGYWGEKYSGNSAIVVNSVFIYFQWGSMTTVVLLSFSSLTP